MSETEPWEYSLHIPSDPRAVTVCRRTLRLILTLHGLIRLVDVAELLATELISNSLRHTKGPAALRVCWLDTGVLLIGAWDADPSPPEPPQPLTPEWEREDGRGLALVRACADVWGWQPLTRDGSRGKYVWCELGAAPPPLPDGSDKLATGRTPSPLGAGKESLQPVECSPSESIPTGAGSNGSA